MTPALHLVGHLDEDYFFAWLGTAPDPAGNESDAEHGANLDDHLLAHVGGGPL